MLKLNQPIDHRTAAYGHFGRAEKGGGFSWEQTNFGGAAQECGAVGGVPSG
jgi:S-adenosylmethionine synthetase